MTCGHEDPGLCEQLGRHITGRLWQIWNGIGISPDKARVYRDRWISDSRVAEKHRSALKAGASVAAKLPCVHRGEVIRDDDGKAVAACLPCKAKSGISPIAFRCAVHGSCTTLKQVEGMACCQACGDYQPQRRRYIAHGSGSAGLGDALLGLCSVIGYCRAHPDEDVTYGAAKHTTTFTSLFDLPKGFDLGWGKEADLSSGDLRIGANFDTRCKSDPAWTRLRAYGEAIGDPVPVMPKLRHPDRLRALASDYEGAVVLAPCVAVPQWRNREYPRHSWLALAKRLRDSGRRVLIADNVTERLELFKGFELVMGPAQGWPADRLIGLMLNASCLVGNDSGLAHLSGIVGCPTVVLGGVTGGDKLFQYYARVECLQGPLPCDSCWWMGEYRSALCDSGCASLSAIPQDSIVAAIERAGRRRHARVRIATHYSREHLPLHRLTWPSKLAYAWRHRLDWHCDGERSDLTWQVWLDQLEQMPEGQWLWVLGTDAVITGDRDVHDLLDGDVVVASDDNGVNCDSMLLRNCQAVRELVASCIRLRDTNQFLEQGAMQSVLSGRRYEDFSRLVGLTHRYGGPASKESLSRMRKVLDCHQVRVNLVEQCELNAYPSDQYGSVGGKWSWKPGDLVCHLPGKSLADRLKFFSQLEGV